MNYYLWISGQEQGPYSLEQIQEAVTDGSISDQQTARTEDSTEWKPLATIARLKTPKKPQSAAPTETKAAPSQQPQSKSPDHLIHLARIRKNTCYGVLRSIIEISFVLSLLAVIGYVLVAGIASLAGERAGYGILILFSGVLGVILLIAARQSALLLIDIADTLIYEHSKNK